VHLQPTHSKTTTAKKLTTRTDKTGSTHPHRANSRGCGLRQCRAIIQRRLGTCEMKPSQRSNPPATRRAVVFLAVRRAGFHNNERQDMNEAPKELHGRELLKHASELHAAYERGEKIHYWHSFIGSWATSGNIEFSAPFWLYRVAPKKIVRYVNCHPDSNNYGYETREAADRYAGHGRIACVRIEYHEGQYDE